MKLTVLDSQGWEKEVGSKLPVGMTMMDALYPDFHNMTFETPLWRSSDSHAGPTGGVAHGSFDIEGNRIALKSIQFDIK